MRSRIVVVNKDSASLYERAVAMLKKNQKLITYGTTPHSMINPKKYPIKTSLPGEYNTYNCMAAFGACQALGLKSKMILQAIATFTGLPGRMEIIAHTPCTVIVDFAHTPNAIEQALKTAKTFVKGKAKLVHVFGSAGLRDKTKRPLMGEASSKFADIIVLTEEDFRTENVEQIMNDIASGIEKTKSLYRFPLRSDAISFALQGREKGDVVIITGKGHEKSLCRGTIEYPWSDQKEVKNVLVKKAV